MTRRTIVGELPVGGTEPLIASAVRWGDLLFLSGRAPIDTSTLQVVATDFTTQARDVLDTIMASLAEAGSGPEHVLRVNCFLLDAADAGTWNELWAEYFPAPDQGGVLDDDTLFYELFEGEPRAKDGYVTLSTAPGLGLELKEDRIRQGRIAG